jgi:hypothetical protein
MLPNRLAMHDDRARVAAGCSDGPLVALLHGETREVDKDHVTGRFGGPAGLGPNSGNGVSQFPAVRSPG